MHSHRGTKPTKLSVVELAYIHAHVALNTVGVTAIKVCQVAVLCGKEAEEVAPHPRLTLCQSRCTRTSNARCASLATVE